MRAIIPHDFKVGNIHAPASKSYAQRAILLAALSSEEVIVENIGASEDVKHIIQIAQQLGSAIRVEGNELKIKGRVGKISKELNCGESGLGFRLTSCVAACLGDSFNISGEGSLKGRPMNQIESFLPPLGTSCKTTNGFLPISISGRLKGGEATIDGSLSSQFLSGLLIALPHCENDSIIHVNNLKSKPYVDMTIEVLKSFNFRVIHDYKTFRIAGAQSGTPPSHYKVEGDWSGAAFWIVHATIARSNRINGLNEKSSQADIAILDAIMAAGGAYAWDKGTLIVEKVNPKPFQFDATDCPDLFPALVVLAAAAKGSSTLLGANRLIHKESNRALILQKEFDKLGLKIKLEEDKMIILGTGKLNTAEVKSNYDHRIAMCMAIAAVLTKGSISIDDANAVNKSYPEFWEVVN